MWFLPYEALLVGMILEILGLIMVIWKVFSTEKFKDFLNS
jgi:hypothetical protein